MLNYFHRDVIFAVILGGCIPLAAVTIWSWVAGYNVAGTVLGLIVELALLFLSIFICLRIAAKRVDAKVASMVDVYNEGCDPEGFLDRAQPVLSAMRAPVAEPGSWFLSYAGQAFLDAGRGDDARTCLTTIQESLDAVKKPEASVALLTNAIPLAQKLDGPNEALTLIYRALGYAQGDRTAHGAQQRLFLEAQQKLNEDRLASNKTDLLERCRSVRQDARALMRLRVEYAWEEAGICYRLKLADEERESLRFVVDHGNKLAFVPTAQRRLAELGG